MAKYVSLNDAWATPESIRNVQHPAHIKQKELLEERKQFTKFKQMMAHQTPGYPWLDESRDRYLSGYYPKQYPPLHNQPDWDSPHGSLFRYGNVGKGPWQNQLRFPSNFGFEQFGNSQSSCGILNTIIFILLLLVLILICIIGSLASTLSKMKN